jgi:hypothetical protein
MNRLLKDSENSQIENKEIKVDKHSKSHKGEDYVFKSYRYEQNTILSNNASNYLDS